MLRHAKFGRIAAIWRGVLRWLGWSLALSGAVLLVRWLFLRLRSVVLHPTAYTTAPIEPEAVRPRQRRIIVSDLHMGAGDRLDDFTDDPEFVQFIDSYVDNGVSTELILAGDTIEFLQVRLPDVDDDDYSQEAAEHRISIVIAAHPAVFEALTRFIARPENLLTVLIGNHDFELHYPAAKMRFREALGLAPDDSRLRFGLSYHGGGIYLEHGNQHDSWNRFVNFAGISEPFEVVRGTQIVKEIINDLEDDPLPVATLLDNVKPSSAFLWYLLALPQLRNRMARRFTIRGVTGFLQIAAWPTPHHMPITGRGPGGWLSTGPLRALWRLVAHLRRQRVARHREVARQVSMVAGQVDPPEQVIDQVQSEAARQAERELRDFHDRFAREMLRLARSPSYRDDKLFVCGHTHGAGVVPLGGDQYYINTGTWIEIVYDVKTMRRQEQRFPFLEITYPAGDEPEGRLLVWIGADEQPQPWEEGPNLERQRGKIRVQ